MVRFIKLNFGIIRRNKDIVVFVTLFFALILYSSLITHRMGRSFYQKQIQKRIFRIEQKLIHTNNDALSELFDSISDSYLLKASDDESYSSYLYRNDTLLSWTSNRLKVNIDRLKPNETTLHTFGSAHVISRLDSSGAFKILSCFIVKSKYPFQNEYLTNQINPELISSKSIKLGVHEGKYSIKFIDNKFAFSIVFSDDDLLTDFQSLVLLLLFILSFIYFFSFIRRIFNNYFGQQTLISLLSFIGFVLIIRLLTQVFEQPFILYKSEFFQPNLYATSILFPSIGDLILSILCMVLISNAIFHFLKARLAGTKPKHWKLISTLLTVLLIGHSFFTFFILKSLVFDSNLSFNLVDISEFTTYSLLGYFAVSLLFVIHYQLIKQLLTQVLRQDLLFTKALLLVVYFSISLLSGYFYGKLVAYYLLIVFLPILLLLIANRLKTNDIASLTFNIIAFAFAVNLVLYTFNNEMDNSKREVLLRQLSITEDPELEYQFSLSEKQAYTDSNLILMFKKNVVSYDSIANYIKENYLLGSKITKKYDIQITICNESDLLIVKPENIQYNCEQFFFENLLNFGKLTSSSKNLYRLEYGSGQINYLGVMRFLFGLSDQTFKYTVYFEINSKLKRKGFTKLLSEPGNDPFERLGNYSFGKYDFCNLSEAYGKFQYLSTFSPKTTLKTEFVDTTFLGYNHIVLNKLNSSFVLSRKIPSFLDIVTPFSYIVLFVFIIYVIFSILLKFNFDYKLLIESFSARLQFIVLLILIVSFVSIGILSIYNLTKLNKDKNNQRILEISNSLQLEFSSKTKSLSTQNLYFSDVMQELVMKFSTIFESDINLYNLNGYLIASSRPEMFEREIVSKLMNPKAFKALKFNNTAKIIINENIGSLSFSSAYVPILNEKNQKIAYLNLPYFARQAELRNEISNFLLTLLNVYAVFVILAIGLVLIITRYITRPLTMIKNTMQGVKLQGINTHIEWKRNDEIGQLVQQYNHMIEELSNSANKLAKSERESAWREMAKQVAHEIKNPLTPMKLSVQHLLRAWKDGAPDIDEKLKNLSNTLIQQIDSLSDIATSFSDFANMPKLILEKVECKEVIQNAMNLYQNNGLIQINLLVKKELQFFVQADKNQLLRVFNNLIKNAVQAIEGKENGKIIIEICKQNGNVIIDIEDNGVGIPDDIKSKIFVPNFTTKSSGKGLGLAMAKNIIMGSEGTISYESTFGIGTKFRISLIEFIDGKENY